MNKEHSLANLPKKSESLPRITGARRLINGETQRNACGPLHRYVMRYVTHQRLSNPFGTVREPSRILSNASDRSRPQATVRRRFNVRSTSARRPFNLGCYRHCASPGKVVPSRESARLGLAESEHRGSDGEAIGFSPFSLCAASLSRSLSGSLPQSLFQLMAKDHE